MIRKLVYYQTEKLGMHRWGTKECDYRKTDFFGTTMKIARDLARYHLPTTVLKFFHFRASLLNELQIPTTSLQKLGRTRQTEKIVEWHRVELLGKRKFFSLF